MGIIILIYGYANAHMPHMPQSILQLIFLDI